ncbi:MAG: tetratricopeptide repeat protein, partial [Lentisphaeria bacterium]|nr:tetratricopeptide repeat protein [Lentisphaeria bacterium]
SHFVNFDLAIGADVGEYAARAKEIMRGVIFPASPEIHAPLYSFFLALLQLLGADIPGVRIFQTLLNYASWLALYWLLGKRNYTRSFRLFFLGASMFLAPLIFHPAEIISESLLLPIYTIVFFMLHYAEICQKNKKSSLFYAGAGFFSGIAILTHGLSLAFAFLFATYLCLKKIWKNVLLFLAGVVIVLIPVITAKSIFYGKLTSLQANTGFNIFLGNNARATGACYMRPGNIWRKSHIQAKQHAAARNISTDRYWLEKSIDFWKKTPGKALALWGKKIICIFSGNELIAGADGGFLFCRSDSMNLLRFLTFPFFCLAFSGLWYLLRKHRDLLWWPPLILTLSLFLSQIATVSSGRYRLMMFPGLILLAAAGAVFTNWRRWSLPFVIIVLAVIFKTYAFMGRDKAEGTALLGEGFFIKGEFDHARDLLIFANKRFKDSSRIENMLGTIAEKQGDLKTAAEYYRKVAKTEPFMPESWMNLANITRDPAEAEKYFKKAMSVSAPSPENDLLFNYARFMYSQKRVEESARMLEQIIARDDSHFMSHNLYGIIAINNKNFSVAAVHFLKAAELKKTEAGFWRNTAIAARLSGNTALEHKALQMFSKLSKSK